MSGGALGVALAASGSLRPPATDASSTDARQTDATKTQPLPSGYVARVNDRLISRDDYESVVALEVGSGGVADSRIKDAVLDRMIDEELRVQRAVELGLHLSDARVRMELAAAVAEATTASVEREMLSEDALRSYFNQRKEYFAGRGALRLRQIWAGAAAGNLGDAYTRARGAAKLLRENQSVDTVCGLTGTSERAPTPDTPIMPLDLSAYLTGKALHAALTMQPGEVSDPIRATDGFYVLQLVARERLDSPSFEAARLDVEAEYWADRARKALAANAAELRQAALVQRVAAP